MPPPGLTDRLLRPVSMVPVPYALLMILAPRAPFTQRVMRSQALFLGYSLLYTALLIRTMRQEPTLPGGILRIDGEAIARFLSNRDSGVITAWTHMTTSDLFIARWIYLDSLERGAVARLPIMVQALLGPVGLLLYLLTRRPPAA